MFIANLYLCIVIFLNSLLTIATDIRVRIGNGVIRGKTLENFKGGKFYAFQSIPYAQPPVGNLRFQRPQAMNNWNGTLDCRHSAPTCVQLQPARFLSVTGQEDCLYLNVYSPTIGQSNVFLPVFVFLHGGGFLIGDSSPAELGPDYLMTEPIVLVTINYRLGVFGNAVPNLALYDQLQALKWVQSNIRQFNGDPRRVTLGGESVGAMAAHCHLLSPRSKGLFHQIVAMSGTSLTPLVYVKRNYTQGLAYQLGIQEENNQTIIAQMKQLSVDVLMNAYVREYGNLPPAIDMWSNGGVFIDDFGDPDAFITEYPMRILKSGNYPKIPMLIGFTNKEAEWLRTFENFDDMLDLNRQLPFYFTENRAEIMKQVQAFYGIDSRDVENRSVFDIRLWSDIWFKYHSFRTAVLHNSEQIYFYQFSANTDLHFIPQYRNFSYNGAAHTDDVAYMFSNSLSVPLRPGSVEAYVVSLMVKTVSNFVHFGNPSETWRSFNIATRHFGDISNRGLQFKQFRGSSFDFWARIYDFYAPDNF